MNTPTPDKIAIVLSSTLAPGPAANVAACLAAGLSARGPSWAGRELTDAAGLTSASSSHLPIAILRAEPDALNALLRQLATQPKTDDCTVSLFPGYAQAMHDCHDYWARHAATAHADEPLLGLGVSGPKRWANRLVGSLPLWR